MTAWPLIQPDSLEDRLFGWRRVKDMTGLSRSTAWRLQQLGKFPAPVRISTNRVAWRESELLAWKAAKLDEIGAPAIGAPAKRARRPARTPKLPGLAKALPKPTPAKIERPVQVIQASLDLQPPPSVTRLRKGRRRQATASIDQIDFGF